MNNPTCQNDTVGHLWVNWNLTWIILDIDKITNITCSGALTPIN